MVDYDPSLAVISANPRKPDIRLDIQTRHRRSVRINNRPVKVGGLKYRFLLRNLVLVPLMLIRVPQIPTDHTGPLPQWNNEIRGISVYHRLYHLVPINPLCQSSRGPGNPSRSEVLSTDTPSPPCAPLPSRSSSPNVATNRFSWKTIF